MHGACVVCSINVFNSQSMWNFLALDLLVHATHTNTFIFIFRRVQTPIALRVAWTLISKHRTISNSEYFHLVPIFKHISNVYGVCRRRRFRLIDSIFGLPYRFQNIRSHWAIECVNLMHFICKLGEIKPRIIMEINKWTLECGVTDAIFNTYTKLYTNNTHVCDSVRVYVCLYVCICVCASVNVC